jgi:Na+/H+ antiporter NhaD/arsenite permease-like protein
MCGAIVMVIAGGLSRQEAYSAINLDTIGLLLGMMVLSAYLMESFFFRTLAYFTVTHTRSARSLLVGLVFVAGGLSAVLVNDVVCLMFTPIVLLVTRQAKLPTLPFLIALASASNIGGVMTLTGNPQNMIIGTTAALSYARFTLRMLPVGVLGLCADALLLVWMFRHQLPTAPLERPEVARPPLNRPLVAKSLLVLALVVCSSSAPCSWWWRVPRARARSITRTRRSCPGSATPRRASSSRLRPSPRSPPTCSRMCRSCWPRAAGCPSWRCPSFNGPGSP